MKENILGYNVNTFSVDECAEEVFQLLQQGKRGWLACFNPHSYAVALEEKVFSCALKDADWLIPDGVGVVWASRLLGGKMKERVTGSDVFAGLNKRMNEAGSMRVFFLGATENTLELIKQRMALDYPKVKIAGVYSPPFKDVYSQAEISAMVKAVNSAAPDVLWVGLTAPKQEKFVFENRARLNVNFVAAIGAVFDFFSGTVKRAPVWMQKIGLEWLHRLISSPGHIWKRQVSIPIFLYHFLTKQFFISRK